MDEFKHGDYAEEGWGRVDEYLRREDNSLCANLKKTVYASSWRRTGKNAELNATVYIFKLLHSRTRVQRSSLG